jgi:ketosteroid isomerase-like protein
MRGRRFLDDRLAVRFPRLNRVLSAAVMRLPTGSRVRRTMLARATVSGWSAFNRGDLDLMFVRYAPDYEFHVAEELGDLGLPDRFGGQEEFRAALAEVRSQWARLDFIPVEIVDGGESFVILGRIEATGATSGAALDRPVGSIYEIERGLVTRERQFATWDEALREAGLESG